jgi:hypothetical protein
LLSYDIVSNSAPATGLRVSTPEGVTTRRPFGLTVAAEDACGAPVNGFTAEVSVALQTGSGAGGVLSGPTTLSAVNGVASFSALAIDTRGAGYVLKATSGGLSGASDPFSVGNAAPVAQQDAYRLSEDTPLTVAVPGVLGNDTDADGDPLTTSLADGPLHGTLTLSPTGAFIFAPAADYTGADRFSYTVADGRGAKVSATVNLTVTAVNDPPAFTSGPDQAPPPGAGAQAVPGWARDFRPGPPNEADQTLLSYDIVSNSAPDLFAVAPAVARDGTLTYTPQTGQRGVATIGVVARDSGGTANGGVDTSAVQSFTIRITAQFRLYLPLAMQTSASAISR